MFWKDKWWRALEREFLWRQKPSGGRSTPFWWCFDFFFFKPLFYFFRFWDSAVTSPLAEAFFFFLGTPPASQTSGTILWWKVFIKWLKLMLLHFKIESETFLNTHDDRKDMITFFHGAKFFKTFFMNFKKNEKNICQYIFWNYSMRI